MFIHGRSSATCHRLPVRATTLLVPRNSIRFSNHTLLIHYLPFTTMTLEPGRAFPEFISPDTSLHGPYAKLVRHISAVHELLSLAPTNDPSLVGNPTTGLTARERRLVTDHINECMQMICTVEQCIAAPTMFIPKSPPPGQPWNTADYAPPTTTLAP